MRFIIISLLITLALAVLLSWHLHSIYWLYFGLFIFVCLVAVGSKLIQRIAGILATLTLISISVFAYLKNKEIINLTNQQTELVVGSLIMLFGNRKNAIAANVQKKLNFILIYK